MISRIYKIILFLAFIVPIIFLLIGGYYTSKDTVPYPGKVLAGDKILTDGVAIKSGEGVWQKYGLMDLGSIWGHGTIRGPDFSALTLHMIGQEMRNYYAIEFYKTPYTQLDIGSRAAVDTLVISEIKENRYDYTKDVLTLTPSQAYAYQKIREYYQKVFSEGSKDYNILPGVIKSESERDLAAFFFWTAWAAGTNRPGQDYTYTTNWPRDPSVGNDLPAVSILWTYVSLHAMIIALGVVVYIIHAYGFWGGGPHNPDVAVAIANAPITSSQRTAGMFFLVAIALFLAGLVQLGYTTSAAGGVWYARSPEFFNSPTFLLLGSLRLIPDTLIIVFGVLPLLYFMATTMMRRRRRQSKRRSLYSSLQSQARRDRRMNFRLSSWNVTCISV